MLGIIASTEFEANLIAGQLHEREALSAQGKVFYKGLLLKKIPAVLCICGVGKANAAHGTALLIDRFRPDLVLVTGIGGAYPSSGLNIGDIAIAEKEIYGDEGLMLKDGFHATGEIFGYMMMQDTGFMIQNEFTMHIPDAFKNYELRITNFKVKKGNFITVSTCTGTLERGKEIERRFNAICENMEGAAVAHICLFSGILAVEIRGISNIIEDRAASPLNKSDIGKAAENVQKFFLGIINSIF